MSGDGYGGTYSLFDYETGSGNASSMTVMVDVSDQPSTRTITGYTLPHLKKSYLTDNLIKEFKAEYQQVAWKWHFNNDCSTYAATNGSYGRSDFSDTSSYYKWKYLASDASTTWHSCSSWVFAEKPIPTLADTIRGIIQSRMAPAIIINRKPVGITADHREAAARDTLRRVIGDTKYRKFLRHGHISVRAASGLVYQIFPGHGITKVYRDGEFVERLCVVLSGDFPPTDSLIMRYLLILNDEADFRSNAVHHKVHYPAPVASRVNPRNLAEIYAETKLRLVA